MSTRSGEKHAVRMTNKGQTRSLGTEDVILSAAKDLAFGLPFRTTVESEPSRDPSGEKTALRMTIVQGAGLRTTDKGIPGGEGSRPWFLPR